LGIASSFDRILRRYVSSLMEGLFDVLNLASMLAKDPSQQSVDVSITRNMTALPVPGGHR
jgi:hypothetical protein